jgi:hypothetical protein
LRKGVKTMTNEEFQKLVIEKLNNIEREIQSVKNQTANLMEVRTLRRRPV